MLLKDLLHLALALRVVYHNHQMTKWPKLNDTTLHFISPVSNSSIFKNKKTGKTGSRLQKRKVQINTS